MFPRSKIGRIHQGRDKKAYFCTICFQNIAERPLCRSKDIEIHRLASCNPKHNSWRMDYGGCFLPAVCCPCPTSPAGKRCARRPPSGPARLFAKTATPSLHLMNLYEDISTIEKMNAERIIPFLWLNQPVKAVEALKRDYSRRFRTISSTAISKRYQKMVENNSGHNLYGFRADLRDLIWLTATMKYDLEAGFFLSYVDDKTHKGFNPAARTGAIGKSIPLYCGRIYSGTTIPSKPKRRTSNSTRPVRGGHAKSLALRRELDVDWVNADDPSHAVNLDAYWTGSGEAHETRSSHRPTP